MSSRDRPRCSSRRVRFATSNSSQHGSCKAVSSLLQYSRTLHCAMAPDSTIQPVGHLHKKRVGRVESEQIAHVAVEILRSLERVEPLPPLVPHEEERRARIVLPTENHVRLKCLEVESAWIAGDRRIDERSVTIVV